MHIEPVAGRAQAFSRALKHQRKFAADRPEHGQSSVELLTLLSVLFPFAILLLTLFDLGIVVLGQMTNDTICRDSVRVATVGGIDTAGQRAKLFVEDQQSSYRSGLFRNLCLADQSKSMAKENFDDGLMTITTSLDVHPPFILGSTKITGKDYLRVVSSHTFPVTAGPVTQQEN